MYIVNVYFVVNIADGRSPSKTGSLPGYGRNGLHRVRQSTMKHAVIASLFDFIIFFY